MDKKNKMVRVGVVGGTGYTGGELLRLLVGHPHVSLTMVTSRAESGKKVGDLWPNLRGECNLKFSNICIDELINNCDLVFFCYASWCINGNNSSFIGKRNKSH